MRRRWLLVFVALGGLLRYDVVHGQSIGIYFDELGSVSLAADQQPISIHTFYVIALLGGQIQSGTTGGSFRISGFPGEWGVASIEPNASTTAMSGAMFGDGVTIGFVCQSGQNGRILLATVTYLVTSSVSDLELSVERALFIQLSTPCPVAWLCDANTRVCVEGVSAIINPTVPVVGGTWAQVKSLYSTKQGVR